MVQNTCIYESYITSLTSVKRVQAAYSDFMGVFDYKVSKDTCHCSISLNWKMRIYYKVQVKSFQTEGM